MWWTQTRLAIGGTFLLFQRAPLQTHAQGLRRAFHWAAAAGPTQRQAFGVVQALAVGAN